MKLCSPGPWRALRVGVLALAAGPRVWAAFADQGLFWPDEFYQSTEQAHRFAFGFGLVPWEWVDGARSWIYPGAIALLWKAMSAAGITSAPALMIAAKLAMTIVAVSGVEASMRLARRMADDATAILAGTMVALFPAMVLFGSKCMTETVSAPLLVFATLLTFGDRGARTRALRLWAGGALASLAIYFRYQNGIVAVGLLVLLLAQRRYRDTFHYGAAAFLVGVAGGMLDFATWGTPFHSFVQYARFHAEGRSAPWGSSGNTYYLTYTWTSCGPVIALALLGAALATPRYLRYVALIAVYAIVHSVVPHKEYRYITPIVPLGLTIAAVGLHDGLSRLVVEAKFGLQRFETWIPVALLSLAGIIGTAFSVRAVTMTFADLGHGDGLAAGLAGPHDSPWHAAEGINRLLWAAGAAPDACGVLVNNIPWTSTGGFAYLHKDIPLLFQRDDRALAASNYLVARREFQQPPQYTPIAESLGFSLFRRDGACVKPAGYTRVMPP